MWCTFSFRENVQCLMYICAMRSEHVPNALDKCCLCQQGETPFLPRHTACAKVYQWYQGDALSLFFRQEQHAKHKGCVV